MSIQKNLILKSIIGQSYNLKKIMQQGVYQIISNKTYIP